MRFRIGSKVLVIDAEKSSCPPEMNGEFVTIVTVREIGYTIESEKTGYWFVYDSQIRPLTKLDKALK